MNHIRSTSSLQHRLFKMLLKEQDAEYADLLQHNDVRWLSRGRVLERFFALYKEVSEFLSGQKSAKSQELLAFIQDAEFISHLAFLCDITSHLNTLNLQLQAGGASVGELLHKVNAFQSDLHVYLSDLKGVLHPQNDFLSIDYSCLGYLSSIVFFCICRIPKIEKWF